MAINKPSKTSTKNPLTTTSKLAGVISLIALVLTLILLLQYRNLLNTHTALQDDYNKLIWLPGEQAGKNTFSLTVTGLAKDPDGIPDYLPAPSNMQFVTLSLIVQNLQSTDRLFLPQDHLYLLDQDNSRYDIAAAPGVAKTLAGNIAPNTQYDGQAGFLIPLDTAELKLVFEPYGTNDGRPLIIDISDYL